MNRGSAERIGVKWRTLTNFLVDAPRNIGTLLNVTSLTTSHPAAPVASATRLGAMAPARVPGVVVVLALIVVLLVIGPAGTGTL